MDPARSRLRLIDRSANLIRFAVEPASAIQEKDNLFSLLHEANGLLLQ
jgi:hypothetical protein